MIPLLVLSFVFACVTGCFLAAVVEIMGGIDG